MNIVHQEGLAMPVDQELINIILNEAGNPPPHKAKITAVSLLFKDLSYSAEKGGYHPVEIRIISRNDEWYFGKRKLTAVCSHQTRIGNLDAHLI
ncbi:DUF2787 family protein [Escherichia coli]|nr:DUF2787 family protein [Escherichia coli]